MTHQSNLTRRVSWTSLSSAWLALLLFGMSASAALAQGETRPSPPTAQAQTLADVTAVRDDFVRRAKSSGLSCTLPPPRMEIREIPSFGDYDEATNTVASTDWTLLSPQQKALFFQMVGPGASEEAARATFKDVMHRSMLVHELAHWWEACHKVTTTERLPLFQKGVQADRITVAYWRIADPALPSRVVAIAQNLIDHTPSPVPAGQGVQDYFNQNYGHMDPSVRPWFGAQLYLAAYNETPPPSLFQALALSAT